MTKDPFVPTPDQKRVIEHSRSGFISACPGAGKTQVLVERARSQLRDRTSGQGIAFLSFTNAAISELRSRLEREALLANRFVSTSNAQAALGKKLPRSRRTRRVTVRRSTRPKK